MLVADADREGLRKFDAVPMYIAWGLRVSRVWVSPDVDDLLGMPYDLKCVNPNYRDAFIGSSAKNRSRFTEIRQILCSRMIDLTPGTELFRARIHTESIEEAYRSDEMRGNPSFPAQRANLAGQPILYCANSNQTAIAEVRPHLGSLVTIAVAKPCRALKLVQVFRRMEQDSDPFGLNPLSILDDWMSRPLNSLEDISLYWQTQLFSCIVREEGFDGIRFSSSANPAGWNLALFDPYAVDIMQCQMVRIRS